jgi:hypothetical protein
MKSLFPASSGTNEIESKPPDQKTNIVEILVLLLLFIPFGSLAVLLFGIISQENDNFLFFYQLAIISSTPTAIFALVVELFMITKRRSLNLLGLIIIGLGGYAFVASALFWLLASVIYLQ